MKNIFKMVLGAGLIAMLPALSFAQDGNLKLKLNYNVAMPLGDFKSNYISNSSFNGGSGEISYWLNPKVAVGLNAGYQSYYQKYDRQTYKMGDNQTISAVLSNTVETMPFMLTGTFAPMAGKSSGIQPYVSAGAGVNFVNFRQYYGEFSDGNSKTSFAAQGGAGIMLPLGEKLNNAALQLGATYNYVPYNQNGLKNLNNAGINAGITIPIK